MVPPSDDATVLKKKKVLVRAPLTRWRLLRPVLLLRCACRAATARQHHTSCPGRGGVSVGGGAATESRTTRAPGCAPNRSPHARAWALVRAITLASAKTLAASDSWLKLRKRALVRRHRAKRWHKCTLTPPLLRRGNNSQRNAAPLAALAAPCPGSPSRRTAAASVPCFYFDRLAQR